MVAPTSTITNRSVVIIILLRDESKGRLQIEGRSLLLQEIQLTRSVYMEHTPNV